MNLCATLFAGMLLFATSVMSAPSAPEERPTEGERSWTIGKYGQIGLDSHFRIESLTLPSGKVTLKYDDDRATIPTSASVNGGEWRPVDPIMLCVLTNPNESNCRALFTRMRPKLTQEEVDHILDAIDVVAYTADQGYSYTFQTWGPPSPNYNPENCIAEDYNVFTWSVGACVLIGIAAPPYGVACLIAMTVVHEQEVYKCNHP